MTIRNVSWALCAWLLVLCGNASAENPWNDANYTYYPGDFNGDGATDVLYIARTTTLVSGILTAQTDGSAVASQSWDSTYLGISWDGSAVTGVVADFNGDQRSDVLLQASGHTNTYLLLSDAQGQFTAIYQEIAPGALGVAWDSNSHALVAGDYNGDGRSDLLFQPTTSSGVVAIALADANGQFVDLPQQTWASDYLGLNWDAEHAALFAGDFNGDSKSDVLVQALPDATGVIPAGQTAVLVAQGSPPIFDLAGLQTIDVENLGVDWSPKTAEIMVGDFTGDGRDDVLIRSKADGSAYLLKGNEKGGVLSGTASKTALPLSAMASRTLVARSTALGLLAPVQGSASTQAKQTSLQSVGSGGGAAPMSLVTPTAVGRTPGSFAVSNAGAATYSIPIVVPPGVQGVQPKLALGYNSSLRNGLLGVGWHLSGLSQIDRCRNTWAQDGNSDGVALETGNAGDRYCLDGMKLRSTAGVYGDNAATYYTEMRNYARITSYGTAGAGPQYFTVEEKNGLKYEYGSTADSRIEVTGSSSVRTWALNKVTDRSGNTMAITYIDDTANGSFRPSEISYTSNTVASPNLVAKSKVSFVYESRTAADTLSSYFAGGLIKETNRLDRIETKYNNVLVKKYDLDYDNSGMGSRSRLTGIQECDSAGLCLSPTTVSWQDGSASVGAEQSFTALGVDNTLHHISLDANGDGRGDLIYSAGTYSWQPGDKWKISYGSTSGFGPLMDTGIEVDNSISNLVSFPIDYNSDGKEDLMTYSGSTWHVLVSTGTGFNAVDTGMSISSTDLNNAWAGDVNGDGRDDFVYLSAAGNQMAARINSAAGFGGETVIFNTPRSSPPAPAPTTSWNAYPQPYLDRRPDFNGDGRDDFLLNELGEYWEATDPDTGEVYAWGYTHNLIAIVSSPSGYARQYVGDVPIMNDWGQNAVKLGDFNGDGLTDLMYGSFATIYSGNSSTVHWMIQFGNGIGLAAPSDTGVVWSGGTSFSMDWDGDGREDLIERDLYPNLFWRLIRFNGQGFDAPTATGVQAPAPGTGSAIDINGDGISDLLHSASSEWKYRLHAGPYPDLVSSVVDGFGNSVALTYAPLTDSGVYTKGSGASFPAIDTQSPRQVVKQVQASDGIGSTFTSTHSYTQERIDLTGRGYLGFGTHVVVDGRNNVKTTSTFRQDFPYVGLPSSVSLKQSNGNNIQVENTTWSSYTDGVAGQQHSFVYPNVRTRTDYEQSATIPAIDGAAVVETKTTTTISNTDYGTPSSVQVETRDVTGSPTLKRTVTTVNTMSTPHDTSNWCVGFVSQRATTSTVPGLSAVTRTVQFGKDAAAAKCRVQNQVIEPSPSTDAVTVAYAFDALGNVASETVSATGIVNRVTSATYSTTEGVLPETMTNAEGHVTDPTWNYAFGVPTQVIDPNGLSTLFQYDGFGRKTRETRPDGTATSLTLSACSSGNSYCGTGSTTIRTQVQSQVLDASLGTIRSNYVFSDQLDRQRFAQSQLMSGAFSTVAVRYDVMGRVSQQSAPFIWGNTEFYTTISYDLLGRAIQEQRQISASNPLPQTVQYGYNKFTFTQTDAEGKTTTKILDALGQTVQVTDALSGSTAYTYDPFGNMLTATDPLNNKITNTYNLRGMKTSSNDRDMGVWNYQYFLTGELRTVKDARTTAGFTAIYTYDKLGRPVTRTEAEGLTSWVWGNNAANFNKGQLASVSSAGYSESYTYDNKSRPQQISVTADGSSYLTNYTYAADTGLLDTVTYPEVFYPGVVTKARDWNTVIGGSPTGSLTIGAGTNRMLVVVVSWEGAAAPAANISVGGQAPTSKVLSHSVGTSDRQGQDVYIFNNAKIAAMSGSAIAVTAGTYPAKTMWSYATLAGVDQTTPTTVPGYGSATASTSLIVDAPAPEAANYSVWVVTNNQDASNLHTFVNGYTEKFDTNAVAGFNFSMSDRVNADSGAILVSESTSGTGWVASQVGFQPAAAASPVSGGRFKIDYDYAYGLPQKVKDFTTPTTVYWQQTATNAAGQVTGEQFGNSLASTSTYDTVNGLLGARTTGATNQIQNLTYQWNKVGSLTQRKDVALSLTENFCYDNLHRLDYTTTGTDCTAAVAMDIGYDASGNITSKTGVGAYTYPASGPTSVRPHAPTQTGSGGSAVTFAYDNNGNRTSRTASSLVSSTTWYSYNLPNKIDRKISGTATSSSQFFYGADRNRYKQVAVTAFNLEQMPVGTETTIYINGIFERVIKPNGTGDFKNLIYIGGQLVAQRTLHSATGTGDTRYFHKDHLGSVQAITNEAGASVLKLSYDPFGQRRGPTTWSGTPGSGYSSIFSITHEGFTEQEGLDNVGLIHMNGRVYDPVIGKFTSPDPYVQAPFNGQNLNRYSYVVNNPLSYTDPSGFDFMSNCYWTTNPNCVADYYGELVNGLINDAVNNGSAGPGVPELTPAVPRLDNIPELQSPITPQSTSPTPVVNLWVASGTPFESFIGEPFVTIGRDFGALAAYLRGVISGNDALAETAIEGMRERREDNTQIAVAMLLTTRSGGPSARSGGTFVGARGSTVVRVPEGWASRVADNGKGIVYQRPGAQGNADMIRIMEPNARYPSGYVRYYNRYGQPLDVYGRPGPDSATHIPLDYQGQILGWPK